MNIPCFCLWATTGSTSEGGIHQTADGWFKQYPLSQLQTMVFQGGTSSPLILTDGRSKARQKKAVSVREPSHIIDIFPTCWILLPHYPRHVSQSKSEIGRNQSPYRLYGQRKYSRADLLWTSDLMRHPVWRLETSTCQRQTALPGIDSPHHRSFWDTRSFSEQFPLKAKKNCENKWTRWAEQQHVYPFEYRPWTERINYYQSLYPDQKGKEN